MSVLLLVIWDWEQGRWGWSQTGAPGGEQGFLLREEGA